MKSIACHIITGVLFVLRGIALVWLTPLVLIVVLIKGLRILESSLSEDRAKRGSSGEKG